MQVDYNSRKKINNKIWLTMAYKREYKLKWFLWRSVFVRYVITDLQSAECCDDVRPKKFVGRQRSSHGGSRYGQYTKLKEGRAACGGWRADTTVTKYHCCGSPHYFLWGRKEKPARFWAAWWLLHVFRTCGCGTLCEHECGFETVDRHQDCAIVALDFEGLVVSF